jgi:putative transposase
MQRTIRIQLEPSPAQAAVLAETSRQFTAVFNAVCAYGWQQNEKNGIELHRALYYPLKAEYPALVSDLHVQARVGYPLGANRSGQKRAGPASDVCASAD